MMQVLVKNTENIPRKYIKLIKWKMYNLAEKFKNLLYVEVFIKSEGTNPLEYQIKIRLGVSGHDIILTRKSQNLVALIHQIHNIAHVRLAETKDKSTVF